MALTVASMPFACRQEKPVVSADQVTHLPALTGLRFVAALLVVSHHFVGTWRWGVFFALPTLPLSIDVRQVLQNITFNGYVGVNIFFILSGFILAYNYVTFEGTLKGTRKAFWIARIARVYPVYLLGAIFGMAPFLWGHPDGKSMLVTGISVITLVQAWQPYVGTAWNSPAWSLSVEAFFYLLCPLIAPWIGRLREKQLYILMCSCWCTCLSVALVYTRINPDHVVNLLDWNNGPWLWLVQYSPLVHLPQFVMGMGLGRLFVLHRSKSTVMTLGRAVTMRMIVTISVVGGVVLLALVAWPYTLLHVGLLDPLFGLLIYSLAWGSGRISAFLASSIVVMLGGASYALYLIHYSLWNWLAHSLSIPPASSPLCLVFFLGYLCLAITMSILILHLVEQPARRSIQRALSRSL